MLLSLTGKSLKNYINKLVMKNKIKSMLMVLGIISLLVTTSCSRIDAGHVGMKVSYFGDDKGVNDIVYVTGWTFYNPLTSTVIEWPTFVRHVEYTGEHGFVVNSKDGSEFAVNPIINYSIVPDKAPDIYRKYRKDLEDLEIAFLKTTVQDVFRVAANEFNADSLISNRQSFETLVMKDLHNRLTSEGFMVQQLTSNLVYPESFKNAINAKNNAVQKALMAENRVKQAEAEAKIKVANAKGDADATLTRARAEAEANKLKQATLTPMLLQQQWIDAWKFGGSKVPTYMANGGEKFMMNIK
jgi:regulator of protease activity HflC (stomatin/prohibitin superfamily)